MPLVSLRHASHPTESCFRFGFISDNKKRTDSFCTRLKRYKLQSLLIAFYIETPLNGVICFYIFNSPLEKIAHILVNYLVVICNWTDLFMIKMNKINI